MSPKSMRCIQLGKYPKNAVLCLLCTLLATPCHKMSMARNQGCDAIVHACINAYVSAWNTMDLNSNIFLKPLCYISAE